MCAVIGHETLLFVSIHSSAATIRSLSPGQGDSERGEKHEVEDHQEPARAFEGAHPADGDKQNQNHGSRQGDDDPEVEKRAVGKAPLVKQPHQVDHGLIDRRAVPPVDSSHHFPEQSQKENPDDQGHSQSRI